MTKDQTPSREEVIAWAREAGPQATKYNDWDEVVHQCELAAFRHSFRTMKHIKPECRHE